MLKQITRLSEEQIEKLEKLPELKETLLLSITENSQLFNLKKKLIEVNDIANEIYMETIPAYKIDSINTLRSLELPEDINACILAHVVCNLEVYKKFSVSVAYGFNDSLMNSMIECETIRKCLGTADTENPREYDFMIDDGCMMVFIKNDGSEIVVVPISVMELVYDEETNFKGFTNTVLMQIENCKKGRNENIQSIIKLSSEASITQM